MFPVKKRLSKSKDIQKILRLGQTFFSGNVVLKFLKNNLGQVRVGFVVGIGVSKKATERNKIKRILREFFRPATEAIKESTDVLVLVRHRGKDKIGKAKLVKDVQNALKKSKMLTKNSN
ncbi:MAG: ribonuclease P protein component [Candidatus Moranbacteria bacterium CG_4_9_14_3_um_filter_42_9]|nr:MAG: ribonuclease P protein component [Candidatus Moranbacteria bacterium CG_4_9_14_3_um_filter_42_9]